MPSFLESISPAPFRERLAELCRKEPAIAVLSYMLGPDRILEWAHSVGVTKDRKLRRLVPPVAPLGLRNVTAAGDEEVFLWTGISDVAQFLAIYDRLAPKVTGRKRKVLDFGCGAGRMVRFVSLIEDIEDYALDVSSRHVEWCRKNLKGVHTVLNGTNPPMAYETGMFDLVYALSIFTHLPADSTARWIEDMARVLAPGGLLILTTHGYPALEIIRTSATHQKMFGVNETEVTALTAQMRAEHFVHLEYVWFVRYLTDAGPRYGNTFIDETYVREHWNNAQFQVLEHVSGGLRGWQDLVVLQRR